MSSELLNKIKNSVALSVLLIGTGCATYKVPTSSYFKPQGDWHDDTRKMALEHPLYKAIPRHREQIKWYDIPHWATWAVAGNDDDGIFGEAYSPPYSTNIDLVTFMRWNVRNSLHNLKFYTPPVGSANWKKHYNFCLFGIDGNRLKLMKNRDPGFFGEGKASFHIVLNDFKPFISARFPLTRRKEFQSYFGWRERGNFGLSFRTNRRKEEVLDKNNIKIEKKNKKCSRRDLNPGHRRSPLP